MPTTYLFFYLELETAKILRWYLNAKKTKFFEKLAINIKQAQHHQQHKPQYNNYFHKNKRYNNTTASTPNQSTKSLDMDEVEKKFLHSIRIIVAGSTNGELIHFHEITDHAQANPHDYEGLPLPRYDNVLIFSNYVSFFF